MQIGTIIMTAIMIILPGRALSQQARSQAELTRLHMAVENAKKRVAASEKKLSDADSTIEAGQSMIREAQAEIKQIDSESKKYEKDYSSRYKAVKKLKGSKDKAEAKKALSDIRALEAEHLKTNNAFVTRMNNSYKKQTAGVSVIKRGKNAKNLSKEALRASTSALKAAQEKYDKASSPGKGSPDKKS